MPAEQITQIFKRLPVAKKVTLIGSLLMVVSLFMPWYQDIDSFKTGDLYLGVTGPAYLMGVSLLALAGINIALIVTEELGKKLSFIKAKPAMFTLWSGVAAFYLLILVNSVYFHPKFGVNISIKQSDFGNFFAFIAASMMTIGGYLASRNKQQLLKDFEEETAVDDMIKIPDVAVRKPQPIKTFKIDEAATPEKTTQIIDDEVNQTLEAKAAQAYQPTEKEQAIFEKLRERAGLTAKTTVNRGFERGSVAGLESAQKGPQPFRTDL